MQQRTGALQEATLCHITFRKLYRNGTHSVASPVYHISLPLGYLYPRQIPQVFQAGPLFWTVVSIFLGISVYFPLRIFPTTTVNLEGLKPCKLYRCQYSFSPKGADFPRRFLFGMATLPLFQRTPRSPAACIKKQLWPVGIKRTSVCWGITSLLWSKLIWRFSKY